MRNELLHVHKDLNPLPIFDLTISEILINLSIVYFDYDHYCRTFKILHEL